MASHAIRGAGLLAGSASGSAFKPADRMCAGAGMGMMLFAQHGAAVAVGQQPVRFFNGGGRGGRGGGRGGRGGGGGGGRGGGGGGGGFRGGRGGGGGGGFRGGRGGGASGGGYMDRSPPASGGGYMDRPSGGGYMDRPRGGGGGGGGGGYAPPSNNRGGFQGRSPSQYQNRSAPKKQAYMGDNDFDSDEESFDEGEDFDLSDDEYVPKKSPGKGKGKGLAAKGPPGKGPAGKGGKSKYGLSDDDFSEPDDSEPDPLSDEEPEEDLRARLDAEREAQFQMDLEEIKDLLDDLCKSARGQGYRPHPEHVNLFVVDESGAAAGKKAGDTVPIRTFVLERAEKDSKLREFLMSKVGAMPHILELLSHPYMYENKTLDPAEDSDSGAPPAWDVDEDDDSGERRGPQLSNDDGEASFSDADEGSFGEGSGDEQGRSDFEDGSDDADENFSGSEYEDGSDADDSDDENIQKKKGRKYQS
ncbi:hypothetical protein FVE85_1380 [Porphyridium purpureum]|uniref:Uncharacterized protein n=1 Tax=Porphyridium purpureum TaxID=35688 RepID=A0A5J4YVC8_PORPP|nr:hypothetical protein FVE85_1380 [Porphyridium purpureum]|eukprot:POR1849..scf209_3